MFAGLYNNNMEFFILCFLIRTLFGYMLVLVAIFLFHVVELYSLVILHIVLSHICANAHA